MDHGGIRMQGKVVECHICCQKSDLFGIGTCQHPVCMECCIRMRVLGESKSCPQCRADIETMYFVLVPKDERFKLPTEALTQKEDSIKHGIKFENEYAIQCYESYLGYTCKICSKE
jgi:E3 ubiquitin-protein ligase ZNF598